MPDPAESPLPKDLIEELEKLNASAEAMASLGASLPHRTDRPPDDPEQEGNPLIDALQADFPLRTAGDPRLEKINRNNMSRILENRVVSIKEFETKVYSLTNKESLEAYNRDILAWMTDRQNVINEEPLQFISNPVTGVLDIVAVVKVMKLVQEVRGIDQVPLSEISSGKQSQTQ